MDAGQDPWIDERAALRDLRARLIARLEPLEAWRALRQLDTREAKGDHLSSVDGAVVRAALVATLAGSGPLWGVLQSVEQALRHLNQPEASAPPEPAALPDAAGSDPARPRIKVKATTLAMAPLVAMPPVRSSTPESEPLPRVATAAAAPSPDLPLRMDADAGAFRADDAAVDHAAFPGSDRESFLERDPVPASEVVSDLTPASAPASGPDWAQGLASQPDVVPGAVSAADGVAALDPEPASPPAQRFEAQPWAEVAAPAPDPLVPAHADLAAAVPVVLPFGAAANDQGEVEPVVPAVSASAPALAEVDPASATQDGRAITTEHRLSEIERVLDGFMGVEVSPPGPPGQAARQQPSAATVATTGEAPSEDEFEVAEADVEIVRMTGAADPVEPSPPPVSTVPVALSVRLKQQAHEIAFDGDSYAAYYDDVDEADVEIIRPQDRVPDAASDRPAAAVQADVPPQPERPARRFLKALTGD